MSEDEKNEVRKRAEAFKLANEKKEVSIPVETEGKEISESIEVKESNTVISTSNLKYLIVPLIAAVVAIGAFGAYYYTHQSGAKKK